MFQLTHLTRVAALGAAVVALAACESKRDVLGPSTATGGDIFNSYVSLGNSITAGFQSGGINDSTQRQSYAFLLAKSMGTRFSYPSLAMPGCPPPVANFSTQARVGGGTPTTCAFRTAAGNADFLNNVAVPNAYVIDPTAVSSANNTALTTFILGGKTQVQKALDAQPTFATVWSGNNDVLAPALSGFTVPVAGTSPGLISTTAFQTPYDAMISQLVAGAPNLKGVLIGIVNVNNVGALVSGGALAASPLQQATINAATGKTVTVLPNCAGSTSLIFIAQLVSLIKAGTHPPFISCAPNFPGFEGTPVGNATVLDATEQAQIATFVTTINTYIAAKAASIGFAYYDPNPLLSAQRASGAIPAFPNFASTTSPYGPLFSIDGYHPALAAHTLIANELIKVINTKYGTNLQPVQ